MLTHDLALDTGYVHTYTVYAGPVCPFGILRRQTGGPAMANVTISLNDELLTASREYAQRHATSLNALIRDVLEKMVTSSREDWAQELFDLMDASPGDSRGWKWNREEIQRYG